VSRSYAQLRGGTDGPQQLDREKEALADKQDALAAQDEAQRLGDAGARVKQQRTSA
jgi:hypothetical protein